MDGQILLRDPETGKVTHRLTGHKEGVRRLVFSPDGHTLASTGFGPGHTYLWDTKAYDLRHKIMLRHGAGGAIIFSPNGEMLATGGSIIRLWDVDSGKELHAPYGHEGDVLCVAFSPNGQLVGSGGWDGTIRLWSSRTGKECRCLKGHLQPVRALAFSPKQGVLASLGQDCFLHLWDPQTGAQLRRFAVTNGSMSVTFSPSGELLGTGDVNGHVTLWNVKTGKQVNQITVFKHQDLRGLCCAFSNDEKTVATRGLRVLSLWEVASGKKVRELGLDLGLSSALTQSGNYHLLCSRDVEGEVSMWRLTDGERVRKIAVPDEFAYHLACSSDGRFFASAGKTKDGIFVWEVMSGTQARVFTTGFRDDTTALAFSPDGRLLATASNNTVIYLWDITGIRSATPVQDRLFRPEELRFLWDELGSGKVLDSTILDANYSSRANKALWTLVDAKIQAVPFLREHLKAKPPVDRKRVTQLINSLDHDDNDIREQATEGLAAFAELAEPEIRMKLTQTLAPDIRKRLNGVLLKLQSPITSPQVLQTLRGVIVLEQQNSIASRKLLRELGTVSKGSFPGKATVS
jgi:WD40 repeat protein